jgi:hypothetical protein
LKFINVDVTNQWWRHGIKKMLTTVVWRQAAIRIHVWKHSVVTDGAWRWSYRAPVTIYIYALAPHRRTPAWLRGWLVYMDSHSHFFSNCWHYDHLVCVMAWPLARYNPPVIKYKIFLRVLTYLDHLGDQKCQFTSFKKKKMCSRSGGLPAARL